ncbi:MAG: hypothetical protein ACI4KA_08020 [Oscillospiraceae bacterium]
MRAFDFKYEYEAVFPNRQISQEEMEDAFSEAKYQRYALFDTTGLPEEEFEDKIQHIIVEYACKKLGIAYTRRLKNG